MVKKLDIMNARDLVEPGEECLWQSVDGKIKKVGKEIRIEGPVVEEAIKEVVIVEKVEEIVEKVEEDVWGTKPKIKPREEIRKSGTRKDRRRL